jgi:hypothetical protein
MSKPNWGVSRGLSMTLTLHYVLDCDQARAAWVRLKSLRGFPPPSDRDVYLVLWVEDQSRVFDCFLGSQTHLSTLLLLF